MTRDNAGPGNNVNSLLTVSVDLSIKLLSPLL